MGHNWMFIATLLSIPFILLSIYIIWRCYKKFQDYSGEHVNVETNTDTVPSSKDDVASTIEEHPKPIIRRKHQLKNGSSRSQSLYEDFAPRQSNTDFLKEFDEREAKRKLLQQQNEEKLEELLKWKSPFDYHSKNKLSKKTEQDFTKFRCQSLYKTKEHQESNNGENLVSTQKRKDSNIVKRPRVDDDDSTTINQERRHSYTPYIKADHERKRVSKVINFVAIKTTDSVPEYKPRNKIQPPKQQKSLKIDIPRIDIKPVPTINAVSNLNMHEVVDEFLELEDVSVLNTEEFDEDKASLKVCENLDIASSTLVETNFHREKTSPSSNSLKFSENKRNFLTEKLFAGNIYVGTTNSNKDETNDYSMYEKDHQETFTKWQETYQRKMST